MPPQRKPIDPCGVEGHRIDSLKDGATFVPNTSKNVKELVETVWVGCTKCGRTLDEVRKNLALIEESSAGTA